MKHTRVLRRASALSLAALMVIPSVVAADDLVADADALVAQVPHGNGMTACQKPGTSAEYDFSAMIKETGNENNDVFVASTVEVETLSVSIAYSGLWLGSPAGPAGPFTFSAYETAASGKVKVSVPAAATGEQTMRVDLTAGDSTNGESLDSNNDSVHLNYTIKALDPALAANATACGITVTPEPTPTDVAPSVTNVTAGTGGEGSPIAVSGTVTDDANSTVTLAWSYTAVSGVDAGAECTFTNPAAASTTVTCTDDGSYQVRLTATDAAGSNSGTASLLVTNAIPAPNAGADQTVDEGDLVSLSGSFTDAGSNDTHNQSWSVSASNSQIIAGGTGASFQFRPGDNGTYTVTYTVADDDAGSDSDTAVITVGNVAPTTSGATFTNSGLTATGYTFTASFNYSDAGWLDTHLGSGVTWTVNDATRAATTTVVNAAGDTTGTPAFETGSVSSTLNLGPGCYKIAAAGNALDDDGGTSPVSFTTGYENTPLDIPTAQFLAPIRDEMRNVAKIGNNMPVKVRLNSSCNPGSSLTDQTLYVTIHSGTSGEDIEGTTAVTETTTSAHTDGVMRTADGMYIYNLSTKGLTTQDYSIKIRAGSKTAPAFLTAVIGLKK